MNGLRGSRYNAFLSGARTLIVPCITSGGATTSLVVPRHEFIRVTLKGGGPGGPREAVDRWKPVARLTKRWFYD